MKNLFMALSLCIAFSTAAYTKNSVANTLLLPEQGSILQGNQVTFHWNNSIDGATQWWLRVGSSPVSGSRDYYNSDRILGKDVNSAVVNLPPASLDPVYATLYHKIGGRWIAEQFSFERSSQVSSTESPEQWKMTTAKPTLNDPLIYELSNSSPLVYLEDFDRLGCSGRAHRIDIPWGRDAKVTMDHAQGALVHPVWITGGNNVHITGLELAPKIQRGCGIGEAHQKDAPQHANIHPRLPGGKALRLEQKGHTFIEGVEIDLLGHEADCFVVRNYKESTPEFVKMYRDISIVNTRCTGIEGLDKSPIGDGLHGDFFQNQGEDIGSLTLENVTYETSSNGITLHQWGRERPRFVKLINVNFGWDERYAYDDPYESFGLPFAIYADQTYFENVWLDHGKGGNYGFVNGERIGAIYQANYIERHESMFLGLPPFGDFATSENTGKEYISPY